MSSCSKEDTNTVITDDNGVVISKPYLWKTSLHLSDPVSNSGMSSQVYYNNNFLSPITNGGNNRLLAMIDSDNGNILWQWDDRFKPETEYMDIDYFYRNNNLLTYQNGTRSYCINLDDGTTHWKTLRDMTFAPKVSGYNQYYFSMANSISQYEEYDERVVYKGDIENGELVEYLIPDFTIDVLGAGDRIGDVTGVIPYTKEGVQCLAIIWQEPQSIYDWQTYLGLYNTETNEWVYEKSGMNEYAYNGVLLCPAKIYDHKLYANVGNHIVCHDLATGEQLWSRTFNGDFMFSGFIIEEGKLIGSCENEKLYCLNPDNGGFIWQTEGSGTSSRLAYLNGVVYFSGGGDGKLHAVDTDTGKTLWKINAGNIDGSAFAAYNPVYVLPAEGNKPPRVFAHTFGHIVCYEAVR